MLLALDPSTARTGWAVFDLGGRLIDFGSQDHKGSHIEKLSQLEALVWRLTFDRAIIRLAFEAQFGGKNVRTALIISRATGAAIAGFGRSLRDRNIVDLGVLDEIAPPSVKLLVAGSGKASKEDVQSAVEARFQVKTDDLDQSDAIAVGQAVLKRSAT